jgi:hypothetical protein
MPKKIKYSGVNELKEILKENKLVKEPYSINFLFDEENEIITAEIIKNNEIIQTESFLANKLEKFIEYLNEIDISAQIDVELEFKNKTTPFENIGRVVFGEEIVFTDPCQSYEDIIEYDKKGTWEKPITKVKEGVWNVSYAKLSKFYNRPEYLVLTHESYNETPKRLEKLFDIPVDSGQLGVYNLNEYKDCHSDYWYDYICSKTIQYVEVESAPQLQKAFRESKICREIAKTLHEKGMVEEAYRLYKHSDETREKIQRFFDVMPLGSTLQDYTFKPYVTRDGVWTSTTWGDGTYTLKAKRNKDKEIVYIKIDMK